MRPVEMESTLCKLALLLDPRYKGLVVATDIDDLLELAATIWHKRCMSAAETTALIQQIRYCRIGAAPFIVPVHADDVRSWWALGSAAA
mmetsp:Transcript_33754/g.74765  ORF Transcript_33754/g.74765 Transcript_33754/m.74765 type:complete len:89 (-) Transcript_33754:570-836(-)